MNDQRQKDKLYWAILTVILWNSGKEGRKCFPDFTNGSGVRLGDGSIANERSHFRDVFNEPGEKRFGALLQHDVS
jgi:hypothetical protein